MAIFLITGTPGHGKTLLAVQELFEKWLPLCRTQGRHIYTNINGLKLEGDEAEHVTVLFPDDPAAQRAAMLDFMAYPEKAVWIMDECQFIFPPRSVGAKPPSFLQDMTVHRHRALDLVLITQHPSLIDYGIKPLVETHKHVNRPHGLNYSVITECEGCDSAPQGKKTAADKRTSRLKFPKEYFGRYKSATMHVVQRRMPWRIFAYVAVIICVFAIAGFVGYRSFSSVASDTAENPEKIDVTCRIMGRVGEHYQITQHGLTQRVTRAQLPKECILRGSDA